MKRPILYSHFIKEWADKSNKTYREVQGIWQRSFDEVKYDQMFEPSKYVRLHGSDISQEVQRKFEENLNKGNAQTQEEIDKLTAIPAEEEFGANAEADLNYGPNDVPENEITYELDGLFAPESDEAINDEEIPVDEDIDSELEDLFASGE